MTSLRGGLAALILTIAAALVIVAVSIVPFFTPAWMAFGQTQAQAGAWTGYTDEQLRAVTNGIVHDLVVGPPDFAVTLPDGSEPVLNPDERAHMRDVRGVFTGFYLVAIAGAAVLLASFVLTKGGRDGQGGGPARRQARATLWRRLSRAGLVIIVVTVVGGGIGMLVFDQAFTLFHEIFFPGGNWAFDPRVDKLVQIFPDEFWSETTLGVGVVIIALATGLWGLGRWRSKTLAMQSITWRRVEHTMTAAAITKRAKRPMTKLATKTTKTTT
jgi:hypothetical protein